MGTQIDELPHSCGSKREILKGIYQGDVFKSSLTNHLWKAISLAPERGTDRRRMILCENQFGELKSYRPSVLLGLVSKRKTKEKVCKRHPYYTVYTSMKTRCYNEKSVPYRWYGARGITVCERWLESFWNFVEDMGERPEGFTLERVNNDKGYSPDNCKWVSMKENNLNRRPNSGWAK